MEIIQTVWSDLEFQHVRCLHENTVLYLLYWLKFSQFAFYLNYYKSNINFARAEKSAFFGVPSVKCQNPLENHFKITTTVYSIPEKQGWRNVRALIKSFDNISLLQTKFIVSFSISSTQYMYNLNVRKEIVSVFPVGEREIHQVVCNSVKI